MKRVPTALIAATLALLTLASAARAAPQAPAAGTCVENWSDAAPIVAQEGLIPARDVQLFARRQHSSELVHIKLCREETGYVYRLLLRDERGRLSHLKVNALRLSAAAAPEPQR